MGGKNHRIFKAYQPPKKKTIKWTEEIIKCKYSAKKNIINIGPLYSTAYPATTSDSVSAWSKGVRFDSRSNITINAEAAGLYKKKNQYIFWTLTKSWKLADWELNTNKEYKIVTKISKEITWTNARTVPIIAYLDWLIKPTNTKKILLNKTKIKWYKIKESTFSNINKDGPHIKFCENINWTAYNNAKNTGAKAVLGRGIKKISLVNNLTKSNAIWKAPLRPITAGPIRLWA